MPGKTRRKSSVWEVVVKVGRTTRIVLCNTKRDANNLRKSLVTSTLFKASEVKVSEKFLAGGPGAIRKLTESLKKRLK